MGTKSVCFPHAKAWHKNRTERRARQFGKPLWAFYFNGIVIRTAVVVWRSASLENLIGFALDDEQRERLGLQRRVA